MQAIVVTFDRLATRLLGCYGNDWIETPHFDRLATQATVFDNSLTDSVGRNCGRAWMTGRNAVRGASDKPAFVLGELLRAADVSSHLVTANASKPASWDVADFDRVTHVAGHNGLDVSPSDVPFAKLVQAAGPLLKAPASSKHRLVWLHSPEPGTPPEGFSTLYFEDFEERELPVTEASDDDPSRKFAVAAGSVSLVDHWLGELLSNLNSHLTEPTLLIIAAGRGCSWMEAFSSTATGPSSDAPSHLLRDQEIRSPLLVSILADERSAEFCSLRCQRFVQPTDIVPTLLDWFNAREKLPSLEGCSLLQEAVSDQAARAIVHFGDDDRNFGIRTAAWSCLMRMTSHDQRVPIDVCYGDSDWPEQVQLFSKPEDIWDVTDLATQQPEVCEELVRQLAAYRQQSG